MMRLTLIVFSIFLISQPICAENEIRIGRYTNYTLNNNVDSGDILKQSISAVIPDNIVTVGGAIQYLLNSSGYSLAKKEASDPRMDILLNLNLPEHHRNISPSVLEDVLLKLATDAWIIVVDPFSRLVSFELNENYNRPT